ncbi:MAG: hypothetical protein PVS3B2_06940 [Candidatus Dormibacteraceae bacterium]
MLHRLSWVPYVQTFWILRPECCGCALIQPQSPLKALEDALDHEVANMGQGRGDLNLDAATRTVTQSQVRVAA